MLVVGTPSYRFGEERNFSGAFLSIVLRLTHKEFRTERGIVLQVKKSKWETFSCYGSKQKISERSGRHDYATVSPYDQQMGMNQYWRKVENIQDKKDVFAGPYFAFIHIGCPIFNPTPIGQYGETTDECLTFGKIEVEATYTVIHGAVKYKRAKGREHSSNRLISGPDLSHGMTIIDYSTFKLGEEPLILWDNEVEKDENGNTIMQKAEILSARTVGAVITWSCDRKVSLKLKGINNDRKHTRIGRPFTIHPGWEPITNVSND